MTNCKVRVAGNVNMVLFQIGISYRFINSRPGHFGEEYLLFGQLLVE